MEKHRDYSYDLLRIISAIAVIMIHVSATWVIGAIKDVSQFGLTVDQLSQPMASNLYNSISRFAVPCFIMLSGAFILDNDKNENYRQFYSKSFKKIGVPTIIFSILYIIYQIPLCFVGEDQGVLPLVKEIVKGSPMYHMWYLYMLIGVYAMVPIVLRFKKSITEEQFFKVAFIFLIFSSISRWTTENVRLNWDVGQSFEYLGYFMVGYCIWKRAKKNNSKAIILIIAGFVLELGAAFLQYQQILNGILETDLRFRIVSPYCPLIVPASVLIFTGFSKLSINRDFSKLSAMTFLIYLFHAGIWDIIHKLFQLLKGEQYLVHLDARFVIPIAVLLVFLASIVLTIIYEPFFKKIDNKLHITQQLSKLFRLETT